MSLKQKTIAGAKWAGVTQVTNQLLQFVVGLLLARMLTPSDFGLVGMIYIFVSFASIFSELGIGAAIVQKDEVSEQELSSGFWINVAIGTFFMLLIVFAAPAIAYFFSEPKLTLLARVIGLTFLISALKIVHIAILTRNFNFRSIAIMETCSFLLSGTLAILAALLGLGVWSLVIQSLVASTTTAVLAFIFSSWRPSLIFDWQAAKGLFPFSLNLTGAKTINYCIRNADNLLIGKFYGPVQLGLYTRAYSLMLLPIKQVSQVAIKVMYPAFCAIKDDKPKARAIYLRLLRLIAILTFPLSIGLCSVSDYFVLGLLGEQWSEAIPILRVLSCLGITQSLNATSSIIFQSSGRTDIQLKWTLYSGFVYLTAFSIGLNWAALGIAIAYTTASTIFAAGPCAYLTGRLIDLTLRDYVNNVAGIFLCAVSMGVSVFIAGLIIRPYVSNFYGLLILVGFGGLIYFSLISFFKIQAVGELKELFGDRFKKPLTKPMQTSP